eukprot:PLAT13995.2.p1 GENE.PLAT13995.2~~PLAT13995.2.p1  ORF type:complete len:487 (+),score=180.31 PLAT13995.2:78-1538(+)
MFLLQLLGWVVLWLLRLSGILFVLHLFGLTFRTREAWVATLRTFLPSAFSEPTMGEEPVKKAAEDDLAAEEPVRPSASFNVADILPYVAEGAQVMVQDSLTPCFEYEPERRSWNLLSRTTDWRSTLRFFMKLPLWKRPVVALLFVAGLLVRYIILLPIRMLLFFLGSSVICFSSIALALMPLSQLRRRLEGACLRAGCSIYTLSLSGVVTYHGEKPGNDGIVVSNHTSFIDVAVLVKDRAYSLTGQRHKGVFGIIQKSMSHSKAHIWFERGESRDRAAVRKKLVEHVSHDNTNPVLVFPEGTCVNNDYCIMFRKGIFELGVPVYPIAIKYNRNFSNTFWDTKQYSFMRHLFQLYTSWAVVCDVWYLPKQTIKPGETAAQFADRVKDMVARRADLINVHWNGYLKRERLSPKFMSERQKAYADRLMKRVKIRNGVRSVASSSDLASMGGAADSAAADDAVRSPALVEEDEEAVDDELPAASPLRKRK